jgi:hypothetical protein
VFAGGAGQTYGCHAVWQMYDLDKTPINAPLKPWHQSLDLEVANQVKHLKNLMLSRPYFDRVPDQTMIAASQIQDETLIVGTRSESLDYAFFYFPTGKSIRLNLEQFKNKKLNFGWYDPRTGVKINYPIIVDNYQQVEVTPPSSGRGNDWVLIMDTLD